MKGGLIPSDSFQQKTWRTRRSYPNCLILVPPFLPQPPNDRSGICSELIFINLFRLSAHRPEAGPGPQTSAGRWSSSLPPGACPCQVTREQPWRMKQCQLPPISSTRCQMSLLGCHHALDRNTSVSSALFYLVRRKQGLDLRPGGCSELFPQEQWQQEPPYGMRHEATLP